MSTPLIILILLLISFVIFGIIVLLMSGGSGSKKKRAMAVITGNSEDVKTDKKDDRNKRRADIAKKLQEENEEEDENKKATTAMLLAQAGLKISNGKFWAYSGVSAFIALVICTLMKANPIVIILISITGFFGVPRFVIKKMAAKRQKNFLQEFPDALEATVRLLKAGMPVSEAILMISKEYDGPVGEEMSLVYEKQKIGIPLHEAAFEATRRMPLPEMQMFATGLAIQAQTGASLSEVLMNLSGVIRSRFRLKRKVKALSSEAIASASIIGALPNVVAGGLYFVNPEYLMILFTTGTGKAMLIGSVIWMLIGIMIMKAMINFKI